MRRVWVPALGRTVSALGFGGASLGARIDGRRARACLERAFDAGVTWFDTAPSYGYGASEPMLGEFLQDKRGQAAVCTKVRAGPSATSPLRRLVMPTAQAVMSAVPPLRVALRRMRPAAAALPPLTGEAVSESLNQSLRRLRLDAVDLLVLHDPSADDLLRDDVRRSLERAKADGKALAAGVAGDFEVGALAAKTGFDAVQLANNPFSRGRDAVAGVLTPKTILITHSVYGVLRALDALSSRLQADVHLRRRFQDLGYGGAPREMAATLLADYAFWTNVNGIVLMSMVEPRHLKLNVERARRSDAPTEAIALLRQMGGDAASVRLRHAQGPA